MAGRLGQGWWQKAVGFQPGQPGRYQEACKQLSLIHNRRAGTLVRLNEWHLRLGAALDVPGLAGLGGNMISL